MVVLTNESGAGPAVGIQSKRRFWLRCVWIALAGVIVPPFVGLIVTMSGMEAAFGSLKANDSGRSVGDLSNHISTVLMGTGIGLMISVVALIFLVISLIRVFILRKGPR